MRQHWPEYGIEAGCLGIFMIAAGGVSVAVQAWHPLHDALSNPLLRRFIIGLAMGVCAMGLIYSPWGRRSGAHMNPAITLSFLRLGRIPMWDAIFYVLSQVLGGLAGVALVAMACGAPFTRPPVSYVVTVPGPWGRWPAAAAEVLIAMIMMGMIVVVGGRRRFAGYTGVAAGILIVGFVTVESPLSGFGMNPARSLASAIPSGIMTALWIYLLAPTCGMWLVAELHLRISGPQALICCKLHHEVGRSCIFCGDAFTAATGDR